MACSDEPIGNNAPEISYLAINKDNMIQGSLGLNDTITVTLDFSDIDGDLSGIENNVIVVDNRLDEIHVTNTIPDLPNTKNGDIGTLFINIPTLCCIFDDGTPACESPPNQPTNKMTFDIYLIDKNGNESNRVTTEEVTILCN